jgi:hypothetical protein
MDRHQATQRDWAVGRRSTHVSDPSREATISTTLSLRYARACRSSPSAERGWQQGARGTAASWATHTSLWDRNPVTCATQSSALTERLNFQVTASRAHKAFSVYSHLLKSSNPILHEQDHKPVTTTYKPQKRIFDDATKHTNHATVRVAPCDGSCGGPNAVKRGASLAITQRAERRLNFARQSADHRGNVRRIVQRGAQPLPTTTTDSEHRDVTGNVHARAQPGPRCALHRHPPGIRQAPHHARPLGG